MKTLFIIPPYHAPIIADAWDSFNLEPAIRFIYDPFKPREDQKMLEAAKAISPDLMFYLGANVARGIPTIPTLKQLRDIAPFIHLCWDAVDDAWHKTLHAYRDNECFNLQISIDGARNAPVDFVTLTPIDPRKFSGPTPERNIRCGFGGSFSRHPRIEHPRGPFISRLVKGHFIICRSDLTGPYTEYTTFLRRCQIGLNSSYSGSGKRHCIKARVIEIGFSGAALLEHREANTQNWIPEEHLFLFNDVKDAARIITDVSEEEITKKALGFNNYVREVYSPQKIYGKILRRL